MKQLIFTLVFSWVFLGGASGQEVAVPEVQRSLVIKHSATWCPPCGGQAWDTYETLLDEYEGDAVFLQAHRSATSAFYSPNAQDLFDNANVSYAQPEFFVNTIRIGSGSGSTAGQIADLIEQAAARKPVAQTGIRFQYAPENRTLTVDTKTRFFQFAIGDFYLSAFLIVKDTVGYQEARGSGQIHKRVLRVALTDNTFGEMLASGNMNVGTEVARSFSATLDPRIAPEKVQIVTVLWRRANDDKYDLINTNFANDISENTTSRQTLAKLRAGFTVAPTVVRGDWAVRLDLGEAYAQVELTLFNVLGQPVQVLHHGPLASGDHNLRFSRPAGLSPGLYLLRLAAGKDVATRRIFFQ